MFCAKSILLDLISLNYLQKSVTHRKEDLVASHLRTIKCDIIPRGHIFISNYHVQGIASTLYCDTKNVCYFQEITHKSLELNYIHGLTNL